GVPRWMVAARRAPFRVCGGNRIRLTHRLVRATLPATATCAVPGGAGRCPGNAVVGGPCSSCRRRTGVFRRAIRENGSGRGGCCHTGGMSEGDWYFCLEDHSVRRGKQARGFERMGPYPDEATA